MSDETTTITNPWHDLAGQPFVAIAMTPEQWATYQTAIGNEGYDLYTDFKYISSDYPGMIFALGENVDIMELAWLSDHNITVQDGYSFLRSNLPSTFM